MEKIWSKRRKSTLQRFWQKKVVYLESESPLDQCDIISKWRLPNALEWNRNKLYYHWKNEEEIWVFFKIFLFVITQFTRTRFLAFNSHNMSKLFTFLIPSSNLLSWEWSEWDTEMKSSDCLVSSSIAHVLENLKEKQSIFWLLGTYILKIEGELFILKRIILMTHHWVDVKFSFCIIVCFSY